MGGPRIQAPPPPPPAPPPPELRAGLSQGLKRKYGRYNSERIKKRSGISSLRISSGTNTNSSGTGVNV
tara:strand:- start:123 stop:326 length:204 start_codon:yes stop_codon:yes gene_type:complete